MAAAVPTPSNFAPAMAAPVAAPTVPNAMLSRTASNGQAVAAAPAKRPRTTPAAVEVPPSVSEDPKPKVTRTKSTPAASGGSKKASSSTETPAAGGEADAVMTDEAPSGNKDWLIVAKSVRSVLKGMPNGMHCGADALPMLNVRVQEILKEASARAAGNGRKTLKACDF